MTDLKKIIINIPDYPSKGINFKDLTPLLNNNVVFHQVIDEIGHFVKQVKPSVILAPEARGFWFAPAVAYANDLRFIPVRKLGKLPRKTIKEQYNLEYNSASIEIIEEDLLISDKVLIIDDVLATGGTMLAINNLVNKRQAKTVGAAFIVNLSYLDGWKKLSALNIPLFKLIEY